MSETVRVGMGDLNVCSAPDSIITLGLGSCVGIVLYDPIAKKAGMLHAMLPDSTRIQNNTNRYKFVDTGLDDLLVKLTALGVVRSRLVAKLAGGAQMFAFGSQNEMCRIGDKNVEASKKRLAQLRIPLVAEDTGLTYGRTVEFFPETGEYKIKAVGKDIKVI